MTSPNPNSEAIMRDIDALSPAWRKLVHEYGYKNVMAQIDDGHGVDEAADQLWMQRSAKQAQWMATNYVTKRSFAHYV